MTADEDYDAWLAQRRAVQPAPDLTRRILEALPDSSAAPVPAAPGPRWSLVLLAAAAGLVFAVRLGLLLEVIAFPATSHPEVAAETLQKEFRDESGTDVRS